MVISFVDTLKITNHFPSRYRHVLYGQQVRRRRNGCCEFHTFHYEIVEMKKTTQVFCETRGGIFF